MWPAQNRHYQRCTRCAIYGRRGVLLLSPVAILLNNSAYARDSAVLLIPLPDGMGVGGLVIIGLAVVVLSYWGWSVGKLKRRIQTEAKEQEQKLMQRHMDVDKVKDDFLASVSQELRTPLASITAMAEAINEGALGAVPDPLKHQLALIVDSSKRLSRLINDMQDFAQLKHQSVHLNKKTIDLYVVVDVVLTLNKPLLKGKPVVFFNHVPKNLPGILADEERLLQILHNLVGNAIKHTDRGVISVSASLGVDFIRVAVSDTGRGIAAGRIGSIFDHFSDPSGDAELGYSQSALGLSVTKQLVELHGGTIGVESVENIGSIFYFTLPSSYVLPQENVTVDSSGRVFIEHDAHKEPEDVAALLKNAAAENTILVVDDDAISRKVMANFLSMSGYGVIEASSADEAVAIIQGGTTIDLILLDVMMPRVSGYEACKIIRQYHPAHELPIILITARNQQNDLVLGFDAGANDFLLKPIAKEFLLVRVATNLQLRDASRNLDRKVAERTEELHKNNAALMQAQQELEAAYQKLEEASMTDPLTGLHNRRFLNKSLAADIAIVDRSYNDWLLEKTASSPELPQELDVAFMLLDIDFFKLVNDTYGHSAGDKFLEQLGKLLLITVRESDYLVRWGGEEFLIVMRYCNRSEAPELAERIRTTVAEFSFELGGGINIHKTCSIGMATYPFYPADPTALTWEQVIDVADRALYLAKHQGRDCWVNVQAPAGDNSDRVNPAACDSLISLAAAGAVVLESSCPI